MAFHELQNVLPSTNWPRGFSGRKPSWHDLTTRSLPSHQNMLAAIRGALKQTPLVVSGLPNQGKTFVIFQAAAHIRRTSPAPIPPQLFYAQASELSSDDLRHVFERRRLVRADYANSEVIHYLYLLDDCGEQSPDLMAKFVHGVEPPGVALLMTLRASSEEELPMWALELLNRRASGPTAIVSLEVQNAFALRVAESFADRTDCAVDNGELKRAVTRAGGDLDRLVQLLRVWERVCQDSSLDDVDEESIVDYTKQEYSLDPLDTARSEVLYRLAVAGKFGLAVAPEDFPVSLSVSLRQLRNEGWISEVDAGYVLRDPKDCEWVMQAVADVHPNVADDVASIVTSLARRSDYAAYVTTRAAVNSSDQETSIALVSDRDAQSNLSRFLRQATPNSALNLLYDLNRVLPLERRERAIGELLTGTVTERIIEDIRGKPAYKIRMALPVLRWVIWLPEIFDRWTPDDWGRVISVSSLNTLRLLAYDFCHWKGMTDVMRGFARSLAATNWGAWLDDEGIGLGAVNDLLGNVGKLDDESLATVLEGLATQDIGSAIRRSADAGDINWLLSRYLFLDRLDSLRRFVQANEVAIMETLRSAISMEERFWLLWHLYHAAPSNPADRFELTSFPIPTGKLHLPSAGLAVLFGLPPTHLKAQRASDLKERLEGEESPTLIALALCGALYIADKEDRNDILMGVDSESLAAFGSDIPVPAVHELFIEMVTELQERQCRGTLGSDQQ